VLLVSPPTNAGGTTVSYDPDRYIATQLSQLKNIALADRVANQLGGGLTTDQVDLAVRVQQRPKTEIVDLFATSSSPEQAQNLANTYVDIYLADLKAKAGDSKSDEVKSLQDQYDALDKKIQELDQQIAIETPPGATITPPKVIPLISQRNSLSKQQDKVLETKTSLELLQKLKVTTEIQQRAILPTHTKAKSKKLLIAGVLGGPMLGLALALVTARFSSRVIDTSQVEDVLGQPIAVRIRRLRGLAGPRPELMRSLPGAAEGSVDLLCVRAEANAEPTKALRVAVIGTEHGAGSTTLAVAMAGRFARKGSTVVLVDADQNDPEISEAFHTGGDAGLPALLARVDRISEIKMTGVDRRRGTTHAGNRPVFTTIDPDLRVLGLGPKLGNTVLRRSNVPALLDRLANEAQVIVFDAGPLLDAATTVQLRERRFEAEPQDAADRQRDEKCPGFDLERTGREHERRKRKRRRDEIQHGERDRAALLHPLAD